MGKKSEPLEDIYLLLFLIEGLPPAPQMSERNLDTVLRRVHGTIEALGCRMEYRKFVTVALVGWTAYRKKAFVIIKPAEPGRPQRLIDSRIYCVATWDTVQRLRQMTSPQVGPILIQDSAGHIFCLAEKTYVGYSHPQEARTEEDIQDFALSVYERVLATRSLGIPLRDESYLDAVVKEIEAASHAIGPADPVQYGEDAVVSDAEPEDQSDEEVPDAGRKRHRE